MKKTVSIILCFILLCALAGCGTESAQYDLIPMLMVDGRIYTDTNEQVSIAIEESEVLGEIASAVDGTKKPTEDGQSNFGGIGSPYAYYDDGVVVLLSGEWMYFQPEN